MVGCTDKKPPTEPPVVVEPTPTPTPSPSPSPTPTPGFVTIFDCHASNFVIATSNARVPCALANSSGWVSPIGFAVPGSFVTESSIENGAIYLSRGNGGHLGTNMVYQTPVNTRAFEATFTFVPSGKNIALVLQNASDRSWSQGGARFNGGAGCEAGFFQAYGDDPAIDKIFALALMQDMPLEPVKADLSNDIFTYSSVMIYKSGESPCSFMPKPKWASVTPFSIPTKISTSPVALNSPANKILTSTGDNYEAKVTYNGSDVVFNLKNLTKGGATFSHTWKNINIPSIVGGDTAYVSISAGCNSDCPRRVKLNSFKYLEPK